jgi:hypothetical protein
MWIVKLALRRPYTFVVMSLLILLLGLVSALVANPSDALREGVEVKVQTPSSNQQTKQTEKES